MNGHVLLKIGAGIFVAGMATKVLIDKVMKKEFEATEEYICNIDEEHEQDIAIKLADRDLLRITKLCDDIHATHPKDKVLLGLVDFVLMDTKRAHEEFVTSDVRDTRAYDKFEKVIEQNEQALLEVLEK